MRLTDQEIDASLIRAKQDFAAAKDMPPSSVETCLTKNILFRSYLARAVIEANNAKVLADLKPIGACVMENGNAVDCYSADQVAPLIQRVKELEAQLQDLQYRIADGLRL